MDYSSIVALHDSFLGIVIGGKTAVIHAIFNPQLANELPQLFDLFSSLEHNREIGD